MCKFIVSMIVTLAVFLIPIAIHAEMYTWVDEDGAINFSDNPTSVPKNKSKKSKTIKRVADSVPLAASVTNYDYPKVNESFDYYDISGRSESELRREMDANGYLWTDGIRYAGMTFWTVRWMTYPRTEKELCAVDKVEATVQVKFRLPRWSNNSAPARVKNWWTWYYEGLLKHENGHRDFGVEAAREVQRTIAGIRPQNTCKELYQVANKAGDQVLEKYKQLERDYDVRTRHGLNQEAAYR